MSLIFPLIYTFFTEYITYRSWTCQKSSQISSNNEAYFKGRGNLCCVLLLFSLLFFMWFLLSMLKVFFFFCQSFLPFQSIYYMALDQDYDNGQTTLKTCAVLQGHKFIEVSFAFFFFFLPKVYLFSIYLRIRISSYVDFVFYLFLLSVVFYENLIHLFGKKKKA